MSRGSDELHVAHWSQVCEVLLSMNGGNVGLCGRGAMDIVVCPWLEKAGRYIGIGCCALLRIF